MSDRTPPAEPTVRELVVELATLWLVRLVAAVLAVVIAAAALGLAVRIFVAAAGLG